MKKSFKMLSLSSIIACMISFSGCKKDDAEIPGITTPAIFTTVVTGITPTSAVIEGFVTKSGSSEVTSRGVCWSNSPNPTLAGNETSAELNSSPAFSCKLVGLNPHITYYVRAFATNRAGTSYGSEISFITRLIEPATVTTVDVSNISIVGATSGGLVSSDGGGTITDQGVCWSTAHNPAVSDNKTSKDFNHSSKFSSNLTGLFPSTTYYIRAYAVNSAGIAYGNEVSFTTLEIKPISFNPDLTYGSVSDIDGNVYKTIQIGTQVWMAENLRTTRYQDGTPIPGITDDTAWKNLTSGGYCWYNNDGSSFGDTYGALYNWYAVTDSRKIGPKGWHVPTHAEWNDLAKHLGGEGVAGGKLKESGTAHWISPNGGATNESGFTGLPGGSRYYYLKTRYSGLGDSGSWWSSTPADSEFAVFFTAGAGSSAGYASDDWTVLKSSGFSVRCVKDN